MYHKSRVINLIASAFSEYPARSVALPKVKTLADLEKMEKAEEKRVMKRQKRLNDN